MEEVMCGDPDGVIPAEDTDISGLVRGTGGAGTHQPDPGGSALSLCAAGESGFSCALWVFSRSSPDCLSTPHCGCFLLKTNIIET